MWRRTENSADTRQVVHQRIDRDKPDERSHGQPQHRSKGDAPSTSHRGRFELHVRTHPQPTDQPEHEAWPGGTADTDTGRPCHTEAQLTRRHDPERKLAERDHAAAELTDRDHSRRQLADRDDPGCQLADRNDARGFCSERDQPHGRRRYRPLSPADDVACGSFEGATRE